jgi:hypothetical protein
MNHHMGRQQSHQQFNRYVRFSPTRENQHWEYFLPPTPFTAHLSPFLYYYFFVCISIHPFFLTKSIPSPPLPHGGIKLIYFDEYHSVGLKD